jgi:lipoyl(octanoyl) transferase
MNLVRFADLGRTGYQACWDLQKALVEARRAGAIPDALLLTEHDHVYTIGSSGTDLHLLAGEEELRAKRISVVRNDRGGDITYHGPGQLVGYPILDLSLRYRDLHRYLRDLEEVIIRALATYDVRGDRIDGYTGVWVAGEKICALGIKSSRWITLHGFALNVSTDLAHFQRIIPCGIFERGVTSLQEVLRREVTPAEVAARIVRSFGEVFESTMESANPEDFWGAGRTYDLHAGGIRTAPESV